MPAETPEELLAKALETTGVSKSELGERVGGDYRLIYRWLNGVGFNRRNQARAAKALGLEPDFFQRPDRVAQREAYRRKIFQEFRSRPMGREADPLELEFLEAIRLPDGYSPTLVFYEVMLCMLRNLVDPEEAIAAVAENENIDEVLRRRKVAEAEEPVAPRVRRRKRSAR